MMIIRNNTIFFKSGETFFEIERDGVKPNTVRFFDDPDEEQDMMNFQSESLSEQKFIEIQCTGEPLVSFKRRITNISWFQAFPEKRCWIISWEHPHDVPCMDIEKCKWIMMAAEQK